MDRQHRMIVALLCVAVVMSSLFLVLFDFGHESAHCTDHDCVQCNVIHHLIKLVKQLAVRYLLGLGFIALLYKIVRMHRCFGRLATNDTLIELCVQSNC